MIVKTFPKMVKWEEAMQLISSHIRPIADEEPISINDAYGRIASRNVTATRQIPAFPMSLVDGFAVADDSGEWTIVGEVKIGKQHQIKLEEGQCARIATGGIVPEGTYAILKIEDVQLTQTETQGTVIYSKEIKKGNEFVPAGSDIPLGKTILKHGQRIGFKEITVLSAQGHPAVFVKRKPRIFLIITGHEIKPPGVELQHGETYDSTSAMLRALVTRLGAEILEVIYVGEDVDSIRAALGQSMPIADLIITTGGTSVGKADNVAKTIEMLGQIIFHGMNVRPGKPMLFGMIEGTPILGFPGFVTSSLVMAHLLLPKVIADLYGIPPIELKQTQVQLANDIKGYLGWNRIIPGKIIQGKFHSTFKTSAALSSFAESQGYIHLKPDEEIARKGETRLFTHFIK
ncbi:MAG: molybdopterin molybdenumtransferase MoeA [Methanobacteriota archaeon]|nr:MAG: molybdopterin molybdenumtransferase MoeA [Euryarchaeota archaeon]